MLTLDQIVETMKAQDDFFGFKAQIYLRHLDFDRARQFLKPEATAASWAECGYPLALSRETTIQDMREYMPFAWEKALGHRGLSAGRSMEKMSAWMTLLGEIEFRDAVGKLPWQNYGAPQLAAVCERFGFPIPDSEAARNMIRSVSCRPDCEEGCGQ